MGGLDFTSIKDLRGAVVYFIHDGTPQDERKMERLRAEVAKRCRKQTVLLSKRDRNAEKIMSFYHLVGSHFALIVRDNDQLYRFWGDGEQLDAGEISHAAVVAG